LNREDIIAMARQAGSLIELAQEKDLVWLASFAKLVAQHEREACAKIGDDHPSWSSRMYSATIRARGQA
jgi:hypothetical protein